MNRFMIATLIYLFLVVGGLHATDDMELHKRYVVGELIHVIDNIPVTEKNNDNMSAIIFVVNLLSSDIPVKKLKYKVDKNKISIMIELQDCSDLTSGKLEDNLTE